MPNPYHRKDIRSLLATIAVALAFALAAPLVPSARADDDGPKGCSNRSLRGDYGFEIGGTVFPPSPAPSFLLRGVAMTHFDGRGNLSQVDFTTRNGVPMGTDWRPATGTYEINEDCTGTAEIVPEDGGQIINLRLVVVDGGRRVMTIVVGNASGSTGIRVR